MSQIVGNIYKPHNDNKVEIKKSIKPVKINTGGIVFTQNNTYILQITEQNLYL